VLVSAGGGVRLIFSSPRFLVFLCATLLVLAVPLRHEVKKRVLLVASCVFYAAWDYRYLALLFAVSVIDYYCAARIAATDERAARTRWVTLSVVSNLAILGYFKYYNFFVDNLNPVLAWSGARLPVLQILLPAGISFYTFKSMSYTIDVYRREIEPCASLMDYATFVTFFPELIAGPIVRASIFLPQMTRRIGPTADRLAVGASLFLLGLTKKVVIADRLAAPVDHVFAQPGLFSAAALWSAAIGYSMQIYCDFSGYSDMAIGTAKMIGYDLPENFNMPYAARNITEFWRRWHMTLSAWLRDYLYIPLGGNRKGRARTYVNLMLTMLLGGLWHGASWNFVLWGGLHGSALAAHKFYRARAGNRFHLPVAIGWVTTLAFTVLCWIPFRAAHMGDTIQFVRGMFVSGGRAAFPQEPIAITLALVVPAHIAGLWLSSAVRRERPNLRRLLETFGAQLSTNPISSWTLRLGTGTVFGSFVLTLWLLLLLLSGETHARPFIYFQF
jgi:alginate O-acetyltransferase complex protein AlgI